MRILIRVERGHLREALDHMIRDLHRAQAEFYRGSCLKVLVAGTEQGFCRQDDTSLKGWSRRRQRDSVSETSGPIDQI